MEAHDTLSFSELTVWQPSLTQVMVKLHNTPLKPDVSYYSLIDLTLISFLLPFTLLFFPLFTTFSITFFPSFCPSAAQTNHRHHQKHSLDSGIPSAPSSSMTCCFSWAIRKKLKGFISKARAWSPEKWTVSGSRRQSCEESGNCWDHSCGLALNA